MSTPCDAAADPQRRGYIAGQALDPDFCDALMRRIHAIPAIEAMGFEVYGFESGYCETRMPRRLELDGAYASMHGGLLAAAADTAACFAIMTLSGPNQVLTTTDLSIRFLAPCLSDVRAQARVIRFGRTLCPVSVDLLDDADRLVAVAQVTYMRLDRMPSR
ncbi:MAG: PaaI family thioesterase [Vampirovibrionales bacterium]|nr:PaaI family thioesterase [Vampirovibrionales bacterium]